MKLASGRNVKKTIIRPWLQATSFRTSEFGPRYIQDEIRERGGERRGRLADVGRRNSYWAVWRALPLVDEAGQGRQATTASR